MNPKFRIAVVALAAGLIALSSTSTVLAVPKPDGASVSPFDKLDRDQLTPIEKAQLPEITVGVVTVDAGSTVLSCAFSTDGKLATGTDKGDIILWDLTGAAPKEIGGLPDIKVKARVERVAFAPDGKRLAASIGGSLYVWDITEKGGKLFDSKMAGRIEGLAYSPDGKLIACGANQGLLFEVGAKAIAQLPGQLQGANSHYTFSTDGNFFASVFFQPARNGNLYGSEVKYWKMTKNRPTEYAIVQQDSSIKAIALSPNSKLLATGSLDNQVRIWDMTGKKPEVLHKMNSPKWIRNLAFTQDGTHVVAFSSGADIVLYDVVKGEKKNAWEFVPQQNSDFATGAMYLLFSASAMAPDGKHAVFSNNTAKTVILRLPVKDEGKRDGPKK
jgi:WD40 repeat protein